MRQMAVRVVVAITAIACAAAALQAGGSPSKAPPPAVTWRGSVDEVGSLRLSRTSTSRNTRGFPDATFQAATGTWSLSSPTLAPLAGTATGNKNSLRLQFSTGASADALTTRIKDKFDVAIVTDSVKSAGSATTRRGVVTAINLKLAFKGHRADGSQAVSGSFVYRLRPLRIKDSKQFDVSQADATVTTPHGASVSTVGGFFSGPTQIHVTQQATPLTDAPMANAVSKTVVVEFDADAIATTDSGNATPPLLEIHDSTFAGITSKSATARAATAKPPTYDPRYLISRVNVACYDSVNPLHVLSGTFFSQPGSELIPLTTLRSIVADATAKGFLPPLRLQVEVQQLDVKPTYRTPDNKPVYGDVPVQLYRWNLTSGSGTLIPVPANPPDDLGNRQVVVLIHGWQTLYGLRKGAWRAGDEPDLHPERETWQPLLEHATRTDGLGSPSFESYRDDFAFFSIRYDSDSSVFENAVNVQRLLSSAFPNRRVFVLAHSMGGLIAHAIRQSYIPAGTNAGTYLPWQGRIARVVTLGTPFHGSPGIAALADDWRRFFIASSAHLALQVQGTQDLQWDRFDGNPCIGPNAKVLALNDAAASYDIDYRTFAGEMVNGSKSFTDNQAWKSVYDEGKCDAGGTNYANDEAVPVVSAHLRASPTSPDAVRTYEVPMTGAGYDSNFTHEELYAGRSSGTSVHFENVLAQLQPGLPRGVALVSSFDCDFVPCTESRLFACELTGSGADHVIGTITTLAGVPVGLTDIAMSPAGNLYGVSDATLYQVDTARGIASPVGATTNAVVNALAFSPQGTLYGGTSAGTFVSVNTSTGATQLIGQFGAAGGALSLGTEGDMAFAPDGRLFASLWDTKSSSGVLATIDTTTGRATRIGTDYLGYSRVYGLYFDGPRLFGFTSSGGAGSGYLIEIDAVTGRGYYVRSLSFSAGGS